MHVIEPFNVLSMQHYKHISREYFTFSFGKKGIFDLPLTVKKTPSFQRSRLEIGLA